MDAVKSCIFGIENICSVCTMYLSSIVINLFMLHHLNLFLFVFMSDWQIPTSSSTYLLTMSKLGRSTQTLVIILRAVMHSGPGNLKNVPKTISSYQFEATLLYEKCQLHCEIDCWALLENDDCFNFCQKSLFAKPSSFTH